MSMRSKIIILIILIIKINNTNNSDKYVYLSGRIPPPTWNDSTNLRQTVKHRKGITEKSKKGQFSTSFWGVSFTLISHVLSGISGLANFNIQEGHIIRYVHA